MTRELKEYTLRLMPSIDVWLRTQARLNADNDILRPILKAFEEETQSKIGSCKDCILDALQWAKIQAKKPGKR